MGIKSSDISKLDEYYRALNYLSVGQLYLKDNPLLRRKLELKDVKTNVIGHWGTVPAQTLVYTHLQRMITTQDLNMIYISGPGHGGNAPRSGVYLEGSLSEVYPEMSLDEAGMKNLFKSFSFPGGVSSHASPELVGSINEGGELGYSLVHAYGAVLDNPDLIAACVIGDGEAETGPLAASWHVNKFLSYENDGSILPILNLNGFKINNLTIFSRMSKDEIYNYFMGLGYNVFYVSYKGSMKRLHKDLANAMDSAVEDIKYIKKNHATLRRAYYPVIILDTPKGLTGPKNIVGTYEAHQIPFQVKEDKDVEKLEKWLKSYKPDKLFDDKGRLRSDLRELNPIKKNTMGLSKHANGGLLYKELNLPNVKDYEFTFTNRCDVTSSDMMNLGAYLQKVFEVNKTNFRMFGPDEAFSNRLNHVFESQKKSFNLPARKGEELYSQDGRVLDSILSEHVCEGALEGYVLTGRHGIFHTYEAFSRVIDSMVGQHLKWLKMCSEVKFREYVSSINVILTSHAWQQDHNGYTHQDPGFVDQLFNKDSKFIGAYFPFDTNTLIVATDKALKTKNKVNAIVASKHVRSQWLSMDESIEHVNKGVGILDFASNNKKPDIVLACCGDTPTTEVLIAAKILSVKNPSLKVRVVNIVDLVKFKELTDKEFEDLFTKNKPVLIAYHGYSKLIYSLIYSRTNKNINVIGYKEEGTITTPFDMRVRNEIDRYNIILKVLDLSKNDNEELRKYCNTILKKHNKFIIENGHDIKEVTDFNYNKFK